MPIVIKEVRVRTVVERRILTETEVSEEVIRKIENRVMDRLALQENRQPVMERQNRRKNER